MRSILRRKKKKTSNFNAGKYGKLYKFCENVAFGGGYILTFKRYRPTMCEILWFMDYKAHSRENITNKDNVIKEQGTLK